MPFRRTEAARLRALAVDCRSLASRISLRSDREELLKAADVYKRAAAVLDPDAQEAEQRDAAE